MKIIKGDGEIAEVNKNFYEILTKLPAPIPKLNLSKDQKYWYNFFGQQLVDTKKLTKPDLIHLHRLAKSVDYYVQAEQKIADFGYDGGLIQTYKGGATNVSGHVTVREKMIKEIDELSKHFGFSFKDRSKLVEIKTTDPGQGDLFEGFLNANHG
ncbi:P27 family phage terminase small subunit [Flavobacterium anhuiense]|uniref:P27 family phage terminase small subunit n=1 Tax=Flavobacterium anhuiense TaxID=459526 RepID=UPI000E6C399D|nr:P27 family phage terminase small subunit [Flavobacterium anhuiense]